MALDDPPWAPAEQIKAIRRRMRVTQREFAGWFGLPVATLRHWERGTRQPNGAALVLISIIRDNPQVVVRAVRKVRLFAPGSLADIERLLSHRAPPGFGDRPPPIRRRGRRL